MSIVELRGGILLARFERGALVFQLETGRLLSFPARLTETVAGLMRGERTSELEQRYATEHGTPRYRAREIVRAANRSFTGTGSVSATMRVDGKLISHELGRVRVHHLSGRTIDESLWKAALETNNFSLDIEGLDRDPVEIVAASVLSVESEHPPAEWVRLFYAVVAKCSGPGTSTHLARTMPNSTKGAPQSTRTNEEHRS